MGRQNPPPPILRHPAALRLLERHRSVHGLARVAPAGQDGYAIRLGARRVASLQATGDQDAIAALALALGALVEVQVEERRLRAALLPRIERLRRRMRQAEGRLAAPVELARDVARQRTRFALAAMTDSLTGLLNRRGLEAGLASLCRSGSEGSAAALLLCDIDHFKQVNDRHGHPAGDAVLVNVARTLAAGLRREDLVGRWGGEEFLAVLKGCSLDDAARIAGELRQALADLRIEAGEEPLRVTVSFGVVAGTFGAEADWRALLAEADRRLYRAKREGRDRVVAVAEEEDLATA